ncbi:MAG: hypothetical protein ACR2P4_09325 [Gammaproteobacteria bacterium]
MAGFNKRPPPLSLEQKAKKRKNAKPLYQAVFMRIMAFVSLTTEREACVAELISEMRHLNSVR